MEVRLGIRSATLLLHVLTSGKIWNYRMALHFQHARYALIVLEGRVTDRISTFQSMVRPKITQEHWILCGAELSTRATLIWVRRPAEFLRKGESHSPSFILKQRRRFA